MTTGSMSRTHPIVIIAAIAVIIFSIVATAAIMGWLPASRSQHAEAAAPAAVSETPAPAQTPVRASAPAAPSPKPASKATAVPTTVATTTAAPTPAPAEAPAPAAPVVCTTCGVVQRVKVIEQQGEGSGLGAIAGGVVGGLLGNQIGKGSGKTVATVAGVAGGAYAGHQVEKSVKSTKRYEIVVRMDDGVERTFSQETDPGLASGDRVRVVDGVLRRD